MSNSSAVAAARRRRAATNEVSGPQIQNTQSQNIEREQIVEEKVTPLQLLKIHDDKLNEIDMSIEKIVSDYVDIKIKFHTNKIKELIEENNNLKKEIELLKSNNSSNNDEKINELKNELSHYKNMLITNQDKLLEVSNTNNRVLEKINEITLATNISNEVSQEEEGISNMKSLFENLLKTQLLSDNDNDNDNNSDSDNDETNTSFEKHLLNIGEEPDRDLDNILPINEIKDDVESSILNMTTTNLTNEIDSFNENDNFVELPQ